MRMMNKLKAIIIIISLAITSLSAVAATSWRTLQLEPNKPFPLVFNAVYLNNRWFICGYGEIYVSDDNLKSFKTVRLFPAAAPKAMFSGAVTGIAYGNNRYVAITGSKILVSADGIKWSERANYYHSGSNYAVTYGNNRFILTDGGGGKGKNSVIQTSTDGMNWEKIECQPTSSNQKHPYLSGIIYTSNGFIAVGSGIYTSADGLDWQEVWGEDVSLNAVAYGDNGYVAVGKNGNIVISSDGKEWKIIKSGISDDLYAITYGNWKYVAVGKGGVMITSPKRMKWERVNITNRDIYGIVYANGIFLTAGVGGVIVGR